MISSAIPFACFSLALAGTLGQASLWTDHLRPEVADGVSPAVRALLDDTVGTILGHKQLFWVTFGLVVTLWELSGAMRATMEALDGIYGSERKRSRAERYRVSVTLAAAVGGLVLMALGWLLLGPLLVGGPAGFVARYGGAALLLTLAVGLTVRMAPSQHQPVRWVSAGSVLIVVGWLAVVGGYVLYATRVASYASVFGGLAAAFVLIVVVYLSAVVLLVGVLVDASARETAATAV